MKGSETGKESRHKHRDGSLRFNYFIQKKEKEGSDFLQGLGIYMSCMREARRKSRQHIL